MFVVFFSAYRESTLIECQGFVEKIMAVIHITNLIQGFDCIEMCIAIS